MAGAGREVDATGEPAWKAVYAKEVDDMMKVLEGSGRTVLWLGAPVLGDTKENDAIKELDAVEKELAKAKKLGKEGNLKDGRAAIKSTKEKTGQATKVGDEYAQYESEKAAVQLLIDGLKAHAQKQTITTEIAAAPDFYYAEDYHQQYLAKNPDGYCGIGGTGVTCPVGIATTA